MTELTEKENRAYSELYIEDAQENIADSFDYAVKGLGLSLKEYIDKFVNFKYINLLETGNPHYLAGMSGVELAREICEKENEKPKNVPYCPELEFWVGWIISYYQWSRNITYKEIFTKFSLQRFERAYPTFHECNEERMFEYMDEVIFGKIEND